MSLHLRSGPLSFRWVRARLSRVAGWLVTSPLAFFVGFVIDVCAYWLAALRRRSRGGGRLKRRTWAS